jgi:hypothetical protein
MEVMNMEKNNKPEKHIRFGGVRVSIWKDVRKGPSGKNFESRSVTMDRAYMDAQGKWQNTSSLKESDVPKAIAALTKAFVYMTERETDDANEETETG